MTEEILRRSRRNISNGQRKKKLSWGKIILTVVLVVALIIGCYFGYRYFFGNKQAEQEEVVAPERLRTTFQEQINAEYNENKATFVGDKSELDIVAKYFAINLFTLWGVQNEDDYNGKDMIPKENFNDFDQQVKNNLVFQFSHIVETYGAGNLPIATAVELDDVISERMEYDLDYYNGYNATLIMQYQDGTVTGTMNDDVAKAKLLLQNWVYKADVVFFWIPNEEGDGGEWKVGSMKNVISNEKANPETDKTPNDNDQTE